MSRSLRMVIRVCAVLVAGMCVYAPWNEYSPRGHNLGSAGYALIFSPPEGARIDVYRLLIQIAIVVVLGSAFAVTLPKGDGGSAFGDETHYFKSMIEFIVRHRLSILLALLATVSVYGGYSYYVYEQEKAELAATAAANAKAEAANAEVRRAQAEQSRQQAEYQALQERMAAEEADRTLKFRQTLYRARNWPALRIPNSQVQLDIESSMVDTATFKYIVRARGPANQLETLPFYYSRFIVRFGDAHKELAELDFPVSALTKVSNLSGGVASLEHKGTGSISEEEYASAKTCTLRVEHR